MSASAGRTGWPDAPRSLSYNGRDLKIRSHAMQTFFVEIKCKLGKTYHVASALADREIASEIYSTAGNYDILAKFHVDDVVDIGHFVAENVQTIPEIQDTRTIITFKAF
jgi:DNA-binding Lrp family transcriptional regulator